MGRVGWLAWTMSEQRINLSELLQDLLIHPLIQKGLFHVADDVVNHCGVQVPLEKKQAEVNFNLCWIFKKTLFVQTNYTSHCHVFCIFFVFAGFVFRLFFYCIEKIQLIDMTFSHGTATFVMKITVSEFDINYRTILSRPARHVTHVPCYIDHTMSPMFAPCCADIVISYIVLL